MVNPGLWAASAREPTEDHMDMVSKETLQQILREEAGRRIISTKEVRESVGEEREKWKLAAEEELTQKFQEMGAFHESTPEELAVYGRPLPMLCVWSLDGDRAKCRACACGNFAQLDPTQQSWTAQAEPSSLMAALKLGRRRRWVVSKHDVKGAFLHAELPDEKLVIVSPPEQWVRWGIVQPGVKWTLDKAVYGLRESPKLWADKRDTEFNQIQWTAEGKDFCLYRCSADSQLWRLREKGKTAVLGILVVYVDDFLLNAPLGEMRDNLLKKLSEIWTLTKEETLTETHPLTFLGIDISIKHNGDIFLSQEKMLILYWSSMVWNQEMQLNVCRLVIFQKN